MSHPSSYSKEALLHLFPLEGSWKRSTAPGKQRAQRRQKNRISLSSTFTSPSFHLFHPFRTLGLIFSQPLQRQPILLTAAAAPAYPSLQLYSNKYRETSHPATRPCATPPAPAPCVLTPTAASRGLAQPRAPGAAPVEPSARLRSSKVTRDRQREAPRAAPALPAPPAGSGAPHRPHLRPAPLRPAPLRAALKYLRGRPPRSAPLRPAPPAAAGALWFPGSCGWHLFGEAA